MEFLPYFLTIYLYISSRELNGHVCMGKMVVCVLNVFHLWLIHQQVQYLVFLSRLQFCKLLIVVSFVEVVLEFPRGLSY